jgi:uncharacterized protein YyaL (SSP411 family)
VLFDGAAEWCHWCHVMDETTYRDPAVVRALEARFVPVRVDVDTRPDLASRYADWGWPATVLFAPDGRELTRVRGYLNPERLLSLLADADRLSREPVPRSTPDPAAGLTYEGLVDAVPAVARALDAFYDPREGSWGAWQKVSLGAALCFELLRGARGDPEALSRARFTLARQRALYDPVWGGVYQYSEGPTWALPHFEKLLPVQAWTLLALTDAWVLTRDARHRDDALALEGYLQGFLSTPEGPYRASQDADLNAHTRDAPFVDGHDYYALPDRERRALGLPRVDPHVYARENGMALFALAALERALPDPTRRARARRALDALLTSHVDPDGRVRHEAGAAGVLHLEDAAWLGLALHAWGRLPDGGEYRAAAARVAEAMVRVFATEAPGPLRGSTPDPDAPAGASPECPPEGNVTAARLLFRVADTLGDTPRRWSLRHLGLRALRHAASPSSVAAQGRFLGELLLALGEAGVAPWRPPELPAQRWTERAALTAALTAERPGVRLRLGLYALEPYHLNDAYPLRVELRAEGAALPSAFGRAEGEAGGWYYRAEPGAGRTARVVRVEGTVRYAVCTDAECLPEALPFQVTLTE